MGSSTGCSASRPGVRVLAARDWAGAVAGAWEEPLGRRPDLRMCLAAGETPLPVYAAVAGRCRGRRRRCCWTSSAASRPASRAAATPPCAGGWPTGSTSVPAATARSTPPPGTSTPSAGRSTPGWTAAWAWPCWGSAATGTWAGTSRAAPPTPGPAGSSWAASTVEAAARYFAGRHRPSWGVTVGLADLVAADRVWVLVTGAAKADTVRACLEDPPTPSLPASVLRDHPGCTWWLDEAAASRLAGRPGAAQTT